MGGSYLGVIGTLYRESTETMTAARYYELKKENGGNPGPWVLQGYNIVFLTYDFTNGSPGARIEAAFHEGLHLAFGNAGDSATHSDILRTLGVDFDDSMSDNELAAKVDTYFADGCPGKK